MKKKFPIIPLVIIAAIVAIGLYIDRQRAASNSQMTGYFENQPTNVASRVSGRVGEILVNEGDVVKKGQPLLRLEAKPSNTDEMARIAQAEQAEAAFQEAVDGPRPEDIAKQEAVVAAARANFQKLLDGPLPEEIAAAKAHYVAAQANYSKVLSGSRPQEIAAAKAAADQAKERLRIAQRGDTPEEREAAKARVADAEASEDYALKLYDRYLILCRAEAISQTELDQAKSAYESAHAHTVEMQEAELRSEEGTPPEELAEAQAGYHQLSEQERLAMAGSRSQDIAAARAAADEALEDYKLVQRGTRQEDIEAGRAQLEQAEAELAELKAGTRKEDVAQARASALAAELNAAGAKVDLNESTVYAPMDGIVERVLVSKGDLLAADTAIIRMSDPTDIWLRVYLPEEQLSKVKVGDSVDLIIDGISGLVPARVETIATTGEFTPENLQTPEERAKQVYSIRVRLNPPDARVKAGMAASVKRMGNWP